MPYVRKNRFVAAIYSFLVWGLGELYAGFNNLKIGIGVFLILLWFAYLAVVSIMLPPPYLSLPLYILISIISSIDAYIDAKKFNIKIDLEEASRRKTPDRCTNCGAKIEENYRFCPNCGYKLVE